MSKRGAADWLNSPRMQQILLVFSAPKTPKQAQLELSVRKIKLNSFLENNLLKCLNPEARKGRFYVLSGKARKQLNLSVSKNDTDKNWELIGWIIASPRQRLAILRVMDSRKFTSEELRARATQFNAHMTRISTKSILREMIEKHLVDTETIERLRFYWLTSYGLKIKDDVSVIAPIAPLSSSA